MLNKLKKIGKFLSSKIFLTILIIVLLILICVLFWIYSPLISYNETRIFGNQYVRVVIIIVLWLIIFFAFLFKRIKTFILSLNNQRHKKVQTLKSDAKDFFHKTKRNFIIALKDAKDTWKRDIHFKDIPVVMLIGSEGSGKSTLINYSNIEYPITDSLGSYKKYHLPTKNFGFYISKEGVLIDTEGSFFTLEDSFKPQNTDELPEDDIDRNKDYLFKKMIWKSFLKFLNKRRFYKKLNGIILVIDLYALLNQSKDSFINDLRYLVKRVSECERTLNMQLPVYVIFTKLDLVEGMGDFLKLYGEGISEKALGITVPKNTKITEIYLKEKFEEIITSFKHSLMAKNHINHDIDDKAKSYLFLKQLENIFAVLTEFMSRLSNENSLKNRSFIRGVYITSAYQENVPHNFMSEAVCHKYSIQTPMAKISGGLQKTKLFCIVSY